jgi:hypothetical protein
MYTSFLDNKVVSYPHSICSGGCGNMWDQVTCPATVTKECPQFGSHSGRVSDPYAFDTDLYTKIG